MIEELPGKAAGVGLAVGRLASWPRPPYARAPSPCFHRPVSPSFVRLENVSQLLFRHPAFTMRSLPLKYLYGTSAVPLR